MTIFSNVMQTTTKIGEFLVVGCFKYASGASYDGQWEENIYMGDGTYKVCPNLYMSFTKSKNN